MQQIYYLRISDKITNKILFKTWFYNVTYKEALYEAQGYLMGNTWLKNNFHSGIEIILFSKENGANIMRKMKWINPPFSVSPRMEWINPPFSNRYGYFEGWDYYKNGILIEKDEKPKVKTAFTTTLTWSVFFFVFLVMAILFSAHDNYYIIGFFTFFLSVFYSAVLPAQKSIFADFVENKKQLILHSIVLELPIWLGGAATIISFIGESASLESLESRMLIGAVILAFVMKILVEIDFDSQKLHERELKSKN